MKKRYNEAVLKSRESKDPLARELGSLLAQSGNYVCDREQSPSVVWFDNGRKVSIRIDDRRRPFLEIEWAATVSVQEEVGGG